MTMRMSFTPLRDVSLVVVNQGYKNNLGYGSYTQPSSSIQDRYKKRRLADIHSLGQNLMSKFSDINHNRDNEVFLQIKDSQISSFANSHTVVTQRLEQPLNYEQDVIEGNHYVSLNETEITSIQYDDLDDLEERLSYIRTHQKELRVDKYNNLHRSNDQLHTQGSNKGKRIILPSTFVGGRRYMDQLYFDAMVICSFVGFPDLFLTFTCNPNWSEVQRLLRPLHLKAQDHPDIITRVFKIKLDQLMTDLTKNKIFGTIVAYLYTIEFQKRGLPHAHILLFLHSSSKYPTPEDIDKIISAEIPNQDQNKDLCELVKTHMIHGPCGLANTSSPCMKNGKCSRYYPKKFHISTIVDQDGFPVYRRRNNGNEVEKNGIILDNRYVVPYNPQLLLKYQAHINIKWCNQSTSIKYLFKYIHKGYDRITATIVPSQTEDESFVQAIDEIKDYLDCRYISPCEACWRIFSFPIHNRTPVVERLYFHLPNEQAVYFNDYEDIDSLLSRPTVKDSMFTSWMDANKKYSEGKNLTYTQFVSKFVYVTKERRWKPRKQGYTIGRLNWIPPSTGELFYLRMMLSVSKGPCSYEDIRTVGNIQYPNFKEACFAMGFLKDDTEYIKAIKEAKDWGSGHYLRKLFVIMILSNSINRPEHVWEETWQWLVDGILHDQRKMSGIQGSLLILIFLHY
ncbi:hypothetical protein RJT34_16648 [Clitoria ternatea]|uniref:Helitron helicase-like domain-containing protein n=1 Tax=Clitoria ternatea TaxID=43366 RepID=A0AAN9J7H1_CLITE